MRAPSRLVVVLTAIFLALGLNVLAAADAPPSGTVYSGCQNLATGVVRLLPSRLPAPLDTTCLTNTSNALLKEKAISWNQSGPAGPAGAQGPAGPSGPAGPAGPAGVSSIDALDGTPCRVGTPQAGILHVSYAVGGAVSMKCTASAMVTLSVSVIGTGTVTSSPAGIDCGAVCSQDFPIEQPVALTATPTGSATFVGWSGACSGSGACVVPMSAATSVSARFALPSRTLTLRTFGVTGAGQIILIPGFTSIAFVNPGVNTTYTNPFPDGSPITLRAVPSSTNPAGGSVVQWGGACGGTTGNDCALVLTSDVTVTASFVAAS